MPSYNNTFRYVSVKLDFHNKGVHAVIFVAKIFQWPKKLIFCTKVTCEAHVLCERKWNFLEQEIFNANYSVVSWYTLLSSCLFPSDLSVCSLSLFCCCCNMSISLAAITSFLKRSFLEILELARLSSSYSNQSRIILQI